MNNKKSIENKSVLIENNEVNLNDLIKPEWNKKDFIILNFDDNPLKIKEGLEEKVRGNINIINFSVDKIKDPRIFNIKSNSDLSKIGSKIDKKFENDNILVFKDINQCIKNLNFPKSYKIIHGLVNNVKVKKGIGLFFFDESKINIHYYKLIKHLFDLKLEKSSESFLELKEDIDFQVMIIEDDKMVCDLYEKILEKEYNVSKANNGEEALKKVSSEIDLILLDRRLPDKEGLEIMKEIKNNPKYEEIPIMMLTGLEPDFNIDEMPLEDYLEKPINPSDLRQSVEKIIYKCEYEEEYQKISDNLHKYNKILEQENNINTEKEEKLKQLRKDIKKSNLKLENDIQDIIQKEGLKLLNF